MKVVKVFLGTAFVLMSQFGLGAAQVSETADVDRPRIGIQAGLTFSDTTSPSGINTEHSNGLGVGVRLEIPIWNFVYLQPEAILAQRGMNLTQIGNFGVNAKYQTIEIPVLLKLKFPARVSPYVTAGPMAYFNLSKSVTANTPSGAGEISFSPNTFEFGFSLGGGIEFDAFFVAANYLMGMTDLDANSANYFSRGVQLMGGARF